MVQKPDQRLGRPHVTLWLGWDHDLYHISTLLTGLVELERTGRLKLRLAASPAGKTQNTGVRLDVAWDGGAQVDRLAVDLRDDSRSWDAGLLADCDVYLKRSFRSASYTALPLAQRNKFVPYGLNYATRTNRMAARLVSHYLKQVLSYSSSFASFHKHVLKQLVFSPTPEFYEAAPDSAVERGVFFQTRVWNKESIPPSQDWHTFNESRAGLVRALRKELGAAFAGGLVPDATAREHFPDLLTTAPTRRGDFIAYSRRFLVAVSSEGLHGSVGFKMAEALAASRCIVTEPLGAELTAPLVEGKNILTYQTVDEAVNHCVRLLEDQNLAAVQRASNHAYYKEFVEPAAHAWYTVTAGARKPVEVAEPVAMGSELANLASGVRPGAGMTVEPRPASAAVDGKDVGAASTTAGRRQ